MQNYRNKPMSPEILPPDTTYRSLRNMTVNGVQLKPGDLLPADSPIRKMPSRLQVLVRTGMLSPELTLSTTMGAAYLPVTPAPEPPKAPEEVMEVATEPNKMIDISKMKGTELRKACVSLGLSTHGSNDQVRARLRNALG